MGTEKRERKKAGHKARIEVERRLDRRDRRRRTVLTVVGSIIGVVAVAALFVVLSKGGSSSTTAATTSTSTTSSTIVPTMPSAAGKPCVDVAGPLPNGAPPVIMPVGKVPDQLVVQDMVTGTGRAVQATDTVTVNYIGVACSTGQIFDSSWTRGQPATFALNQVIPGWTQGLVGMQPNGRRELIIPADLGYGAQGNSPLIAPDEALVFVVDLVSAEPAGTNPTTAPN